MDKFCEAKLIPILIEAYFPPPEPIVSSIFPLFQSTKYSSALRDISLIDFRIILTAFFVRKLMGDSLEPSVSVRQDSIRFKIINAPLEM